jgi:hypothetical protein
MSPKFRQQRHDRKAEVRIEAIKADMLSKHIPAYKESKEQAEKREARVAKAKRKVERIADAERSEDKADAEGEMERNKRQKREKQDVESDAEMGQGDGEPEVEPFLSSSFGSTPSTHGRQRQLSRAALEAIADGDESEPDAMI